MTVVYHINDLKVSHKDPSEVTNFTTYLSTIYGKKITVYRGNVHGCLGVDLEQSEPGVLKASINKYIQNLLG